MKYIERMTKVYDDVKSLNLPTANKRVEAILHRLEGEYMIKISKSNPWWGSSNDSNQYLGTGTFFYGLEFTNRKEATRFKREELPEVIKRLHNLKKLKLVKI